MRLGRTDCEASMRRYLRLVPVLIVLLATGGCFFDYFFVAMEVECPRDEDGNPIRCYPKNKWNLIKCTTFASSPFELYAGNYKLELDMDEAAAARMAFPKKLQANVQGTDENGDEVFDFTTPTWKVNRNTGRVEETVAVSDDLIVPAGGTVCIRIKTKGGGELVNGMLMGILWEPIVAREAD